MRSRSLQRTIETGSKKDVKNKTSETIADELETDLFIVKQIGEVIKHAAPYSTLEELAQLLIDKNIKLDD